MKRYSLDCSRPSWLYAGSQRWTWVTFSSSNPTQPNPLYQHMTHDPFNSATMKAPEFYLDAARAIRDILFVIISNLKLSHIFNVLTFIVMIRKIVTVNEIF